MVKSSVYPFHGGQLRQIAEQFGIPAADLLDFSANINPNGPPLGVVPALHVSLDDLSTLTEYPDLCLTDLKHSLACYTDTDDANILIANGFVPLLEATLRALGIQTCILPIPAFVEYRKTLERSGVDIIAHPLNAPSFRYDPARIFAGQGDAVLLANPQNPSGVCHDGEFLRTLVMEALSRNIFVLLDEAFIDYVPVHSLVSAVSELPNLVVFRSVTKFYGIPGLRVAYAVTNPHLSEKINDNLPPWPVTTIASKAVIAALDDDEYAERSRSENTILITRLETDLLSLGLNVYPSSANFVLFSLSTSIDSDEFWKLLILQHRIVVRSCANYEGLPRGYFRIAVRLQSENTRLVIALTDTLSKLRQS